MLVQQRNPNNGTHWFSTEKEGYYGNSKRLIICDPEKGYARALGMFLSQKRELSLQVQVYTDLEGVEEEQADCLIISDQFPEEERKKLTGKTVFLLTGDPGQPPGEGEEILYKYQPGEKILEAVLKAWGEKGSGEDIFRRPSGREPGKLIGVFSPVHRIGKTGYALRLGEELAARENVLYLNLEVYGGIGGHFEEGGQTLADVVYYARQEKGNLGMILASMVRHRNGLDYVLPMPMPEDMKSIRGEEWRELALRILRESLYETVILDIDEAVPGLYSLLEACVQIHMPEVEDPLAQAKIRQFREEAALLGRDDILGKILWRKEPA